jgi:hypothetical protein
MDAGRRETGVLYVPAGHTARDAVVNQTGPTDRKRAPAQIEPGTTTEVNCPSARVSPA